MQTLYFLIINVIYFLAALRTLSEDEQEMGVVVIPTSSAPTSAPTSNKTAAAAVPPLSMPRAMANNFMAGGGASTKSGRGSVTFDTTLYQREEADEKEDFQSNRSSAKELRGTFSRQPSYRESTIIDGSTGKETIKVLSMKQSDFDEQQEMNPSATSTRQNSGGTVVG